MFPKPSLSDFVDETYTSPERSSHSNYGGPISSAQSSTLSSDTTGNRIGISKTAMTGVANAIAAVTRRLNEAKTSSSSHRNVPDGGNSSYFAHASRPSFNSRYDAQNSNSHPTSRSYTKNWQPESRKGSKGQVTGVFDAERANSFSSRSRNFESQTRTSKPSLPSKSSSVHKSQISSSSDANDTTQLAPEVLHCIVCKMSDFESNSAYDKHLQCPHHLHMFQLQTDRNNNLEQFKRAGAKLATRTMEFDLQQKGNNSLSSSSSNFTRCAYCQCTVLNQLVTEHNLLLQHKELLELMRPLCCGIKFFNRHSYETHRTTRKHIAIKSDLERKFIIKVIIDSEKASRIKAQTKWKPLKTSELLNSLSLSSSTYVENVLHKMRTSPFIHYDKHDYCLSCEVSVPNFRKAFHPNSTDHHENTVIFISDFKVWYKYYLIIMSYTHILNQLCIIVYN